MQSSVVHVVIVGAGCFGVSTAVHLLKSDQAGRFKVTIVDASDVLPAPDAASTDLNKVVRSSYSDPFYTRFALEAIREWRSLGDAYHESGVLVLGGKGDYGLQAYKHDTESKARTALFNNPAVQSRLPEGNTIASFAGADSPVWLNYDGGWAHATLGMSLLLKEAVALGAHLVAGNGLEELLFASDSEGGHTTQAKPGARVVGVKLKNGDVLKGDLVVLAMGSWTASALQQQPQLGISERVLATGQCVAHLQLDEALAAKYRDVPVILDFETGFYTFPPNESNILKIAIHGEGFTFTTTATTTDDNEKVDGLSRTAAAAAVSTPRTVRSHGETEGLFIPLEMVHLLRARLRAVFPELAELPFKSTRMCWYTDTADEDWLIDAHPEHPNLYFATGGSGHAFKFLPVIGRLVAERINGTLAPELAAKFSWTRPSVREYGFRRGEKAKSLSAVVLASNIADLAFVPSL